jgi:hypothetical protein
MQLDFDNRGGIRRMYAIPTRDILRISKKWSLDKVTPELKRRDRIIELPFSEQTYNFREEHSVTEDGDRYAVSISGTIPSQLVDEWTLYELRCDEWIVLHQDARGRIRLSGTKLIPLRFSSVSDTGTAPNELNGETFNFSAIESEASPDCHIEDINNL